MLVKEYAQKYNKTEKIKTYKEKIKNLLHQKNPVGLGYLGKVLRSNVPFDDTAFHASIITGQRKNPSTGICELLVRDSYGSNCKDQRDDVRYAQ